MSLSASTRLASSLPVRRRHVAALLAAFAALPASGTTLTYLNGQPAYSNPINTTLADSYTLFINSGIATQSGLISGNGSITKNGAGTLTLSANNTYTGATLVDAGTLRLTGTLYSQGVSAGSITINNGGTLALNRQDIFGVHTTSSPVAITIGAGGMLTNSGATVFNTLNNLTLNGGTLFADAGNSSTWTAYQLKGTVTVGGSSASAISTNNAANSQIQLGNNTASGSTTFNVADVTGSGAEDLVVGATLQNGRDAGGSAVASGLVKTGAGSLTLSGANTFTGNLQLNSGTLGIGNNQALGAGAVVISGGTIRAVNAARTVSNPLTLNGSFTVGRLTTFTGAAALGANITITADNYDGVANGDSTFSGVISGTGRSVTIAEGAHGLGTGAVVFSGANTYTGTTTVQSGRLVVSNTSASTAYQVDSGAVLELNVASGSTDLPGASFTGAGTLRKSGAGTVYWGGGAGTFALGTGSLIDVQAGTFRGGYGANEDWSANHSDLNVASGATFNSVEANVRVNVLTGSGTIASGLNSSGYQNFTFGVDGGSGTFAGVLADNGSDVGNYVKAGSGSQTLSGANTYTGSTTVQSGSLVLSNTSASTAYVIDSGAVLELAYASDTDLPSATFSGTGTLRKSGDGSVYWGGGAGTFALGSGALIDVQAGTFRGGSNVNEDWSANLADLNVAAGATFAGIEANVRVDALTGSGTISSGYVAGFGYQNLTFGVDGGSGTFAGVLADTDASNVGNFVKAGAGTQTLTGASTYTGSTTLAGGTLALGSAGALGATSLISFTGGTLQFSSANTTDYSAVFDTSAGQLYRFDTNGQSVSLASALTSSGGSLVKLGTGTLTLSGANTFAGGVTVSGGTLRATTSASALGAGSLTLAGGSLTLANDSNLSFSRPTTVSSDATITIDRLTSGTVATLTHTLGTLSIGAQTLSSARGGNITSGTAAVSFGNTTLTGDAVFAPGLNSQINLSTVSQSGGARSLTVDGAGILNLQSSTGTYTGVTTVRNGVILLVTNSIGNGNASSPIGIAGNDAANLVINGGTLRLTNGTNTDRLFTLGTSGGTIDVPSGGSVLFNNPGSLALSGSNTSRTLTLASATGSINLFTPSLGDNGTGATSLAKTGNGYWILGGANTYTGPTTVTGGILGLTGSATLASSNLVLSNGGTLALTGTTPALGTGAGQVQFTGSGGGGFAAYGGPLTVTTFASTPIWGTGGALVDGAVLALGSSISTHALTLPSAIDLGTGQTRSFNIFDNTATPDDLVTLSGVVSGGTSTFLKNGSGTLVLTAANTYAGSTTVASGTLALAASGTISAANLNLNNGGVLATNDGIGFSRAFGTGAGQVQLSGSGGGFAAYGGPLTLGFAGNPVWGSTSGFGGNLVFGSVNADDVVTWTTPFSLGGSGRTIQVNDNLFSTADYAVVSGLISGNASVGLTKSGNGTLVLSGANTYTGATTINGGTLAATSLPSVGAGAGSLGAPTTVANGTIALSGGTLRYTGAGDTTDRILSMPSTAAATVEASGTGPIVFTSDLSVTGGNTKSFTLGGTSTAANEFRGAIVNNSAVNLTLLGKTGPGTWIVSGNNTYTGSTTVVEGTLRLGSSTALANSALTVNSAAPGTAPVLDLGGFDATVSSLTLGGNTGASPTSSASIAATGGGTLTLGGNVTYNTTGNPLGSTIAAGLNLGSATRTFTVNDSTTAAVDLTVTGNIGETASAGLTKNGTGALLLSGANTYTGGTTFSSGTLIAGSNSAFGTSTLTFASGTLQGDGTPRTLANPVSITTTVPIFGGTGDLTLTGLLTNNTNSNPTFSVTNTGATTLGPIALANSSTSRTVVFQTTGGLVTLGGVVANGGGSTASGITKIGSGTLALAAANTYGGATIVTDGTLRLDVDNAIPSASAVTLSAPAAATPLYLDIHGRATTVSSLALASGNFASSQVIDSSGGGLLSLGGNLTYNAGAAVTTTGSIISAALDLGAATRTFTVNDSTGITNDLAISGVISDTTLAGLTKNGGGTLALTGVNTYRGATTIAAGTVAIDSLPSVGAGPGPLGAPATVADGTIALAGGTLRYTGASASVTDRVVNLSGSSVGGTLDASGMGAFVFTSAFTATGSGSKTLTLTGTNGGGNSIQGAIVNGSGTTSVTKTGSGTWVLSGANTYTGATTVSDGSLLLGANNALTVSSLTVASTQAGGTATFDLNGFNATVPGLALGGGTGSTSATLSRVLATGGGVLSLGSSGVTYSSTNNNAGSTISAALDLGTAVRTFTVNDSTAADADLTVSGSISSTSSGGGLAKSGLGTLVLSGVNTYTGTTTVSQGTVRLGSATALPSTALTIASNSTGVTATLDLNGNDLTVASLTFGGTGTTTSVSNLIATGGGTLTLGGDLTYNSLNNPLGSTLSAALNLGATSGRTFNIADSTTAASDLTVSGSIGESLASTALIKTNGGVLTLAAPSTYTGPTLVNGGALALTGSGTISAANLYLNGGVFATNDTIGFSRTLGFGNGQVQLGNNGGFAAHGGNLTLSSFTGTPEWGLTPGFIPGGSTLAFGSTGADGVVTWTNPFSLGANNTRTITVNDNTATAADLAVISGVISSGANGALTKSGAGTLVLTAANTYTGATTVSGGTLALAGSGALGSANLSLNGGVLATNDNVGFSRALGTGAGQVQLGFSGGGFAAYGGNLTLSSFTGTPVWGSTSGFFNSGGSTLLFGSVNATDTVTWTNDFSLGSASRTIQVTDNLFTTADSAVISGVISGGADIGFTKTGNGTLLLSGANTYTGATTISGGILSVTTLPSVGGGAGSLGAPTTVANGTIALNGGTLRYTGAPQTTDRVLNLTASSSVDASGSGPLTFTSALTSTTGGSKTLTLTGTGAFANTFQGAIVNGSGTTSLLKTGSGTWVLSGNNTYTGSTTVSDGTLSLGSSSSLLNNTALTVASNVPGSTATLDLNGFNAIASSLTLGDAAGSSSASGSQLLATGGGILSLTGNVTFNSVNNPTGASVTAGLNLGSATRTFTVADSTSAAYDLAVSGVVSENTSSGLIKAGSGTLLLSGANTYTGGTTIGAGTVAVGSDTAFGTGAVSLSGGALRSDVMPRTLANALNVTSGTAGVIAGTGDLTFTGTLTNTFVNNFTTLTVSNAGATTFSGPINLGTSTSGRGMVFNTTGGLVTLSGVISNGPSSTTSSVYKTGSGTLEIGAANTYTGSTVVLDGTLRLGAAGTLSTGALSVVAGYPGAAAVFDLNGRSVTIPGITVGGSGSTTGTIGAVGGSGATSTSSGNLIATGGGTITLSGNLTYQATGNPLGSTIAANLNFGTGGRTFFVNDSTTAPIDLTVTGNIAETAVGSGLFKSSAGTLLLSGANTYTGSTTVNDGTLRLGSAAALPATALFISDSASGGTATLDLGGYDASTTGLTFSGSFANNTNQLIATGGGALTLIGGAGVTYSATNNPLGSLLSADLRLGSATRTFSVGDSTSTSTELTVSGNISGTGAGLTKAGTGVLLLSGANTYTGATTVNDGTLRLGSSAALPAATALTIASNVSNGTAILDLNGQNATVASLSFGGINASALTNSASQLIATGGGTLTLSGALTYSPLGNPLGAVVSGGLVLSSGSAQLFQIGDSTTAASDLTISGAIGETVSSGFTKSGAGTLLLSGANTYTGPTIINEGTVLLGAAGSLSSGSAITLANSARARLDLAGYNQVIGGLSGGGSLGGNVSLGSASLTVRGGGSYSGTLSGSGSLIKEGSATLSLPTAQAYTGGTTLRAGALELGQDGSLGSGPLGVTGGSLSPLGASRSLANALTLNGTLGLASSAANYAFTFSGPVTLAGDSTVAATQSTGSLDVVHTFSGVIDGAHALTLSRTGAATLGASAGFALSGANTFSGGLTVDNTRLFVSSDANLGAPAGGLTLRNGAILQTSATLDTARLLTLGSGGGTLEHGANALTFTGLSGSGDLTKTGTGLLTLTGTSTYEGTLASSTDLVLAPGSSFRFGPLGSTNTAIANDGTLIFNSTGARSFGQVISGSGSVEIEGSSTGVFSLGAVNTYTGDTILRSGTLAFSALSNFGSAGDLVFAGGTLRWASGNTADPSARFAPLAGFDASLDPNGQDLTLGTALTGSAGLTLSGSGTLTLGAANTYAGNTTVRDGTLLLGAASALPATGVELRSSSAGGTATLDLNGHDATVSALTLGGATATSASRVLATGGGTLALTGDVTFDATNAPLGASIAANLDLGSGATRTFAIGDSASAATDLTITGAIGQTSASGLTKTGAGTLALGAVNTYTGLTTIQGGTLRLDVADALPSGNSVAIADAIGARLDLAGHDQTLADLSGGGSSGGEISLGSATLTLSSGTFAGLISGSGSLVKTSAGTLSLTHGNTYGGGTTLGAGTLQVGFDTALGSGPLTVTGGTLVPLGSARTLANALTLDGDLTLATSGGSPYAVSFTGATTLTRDVTLTASQDSGSLNVAHTFSGVIDGAHALTLTRAGAASLATGGGFAFSGANTFSGGLTIDNTRLSVSSDANLGDASGGLTLRNGGILAATAPLTSGRTLSLDTGGGVLEGGANAVSFAGLSGSGNLLRTGSGALTLTGTSTYNGTYTSSTALVLASGSSFRFGPQGTTNSSIINNGTLAFDSSSSRSFSRVISGSGAVAIEGTTGTVFQLTGVNSYSGGTVLRGATLQFAAPFNLGSGNVTFDGGTLRWGTGNTTDISSRLAPLGASGGTADLNGQALTFGTAVTGTGGLALTGGGSLTLTGDSTFGGALTIGSGTTVNLGAGGATGSVAGPVVNNGSLVVNRGNDLAYQGVLSGSGLFTKNGAGSITLGGDNSGFSGASSLNAGTVALAHNNALGTGAATLNGASLEASGGARTLATPFRLNADTTIGGSEALTLTGSLTLLRNRDLTISNTALTTLSGSIGQSGGGRGLNKYGAGELQLTGANTYSGGTYIGEGTVRINNLSGSAFGTGAVTVESGATLTGAGSFTGALQLNPGATFSPGNSPGLATIGSGSVLEGTTLLEIGGPARATATSAGAGFYDAIDVGSGGAGSVILGGELQVLFFGGYVPAGTFSFQLIKAGSFSGSFAQVSLPSSSSYHWDLSRLETDGILSLTAVPEPGAAAALAALAGLGFALRRRRHRR